MQLRELCVRPNVTERMNHDKPMRILLVSPHFAPTNAADSHRIRLLLPFLDELGWESEVLAIRPEQTTFPADEWLLSGIPVGVQVHRVGVLGKPWSSLPGLGILDYRAMPAMKTAGDRLLGSKPFDLVFFSTTVFALHTLGVRWKKKFGVPFVMDYQDLWTTDFYHEQNIRPPGGWLKYRISSAIAKRQQRAVLDACDGILAVTDAYFNSLAQESPRVSAVPKLGMPFPACQSDRQRIVQSPLQQSFFAKEEGVVNWVYVGVVGPLMQKAVTALLKGLAQFVQLHRETTSRLRLHFLGTSYAAPGTGKPSVRPIAVALGIDHMVQEVTDRIPYSMALQCLEDADALIVPATNDPTYTASKIYSYLLTQKPILAVFRQESQVCSLIDNVGGAIYVRMTENSDSQHLADQVQASLSPKPPFIPIRPLDVEAFEAYSDRASARRLDSLFRRVIGEN